MVFFEKAVLFFYSTQRFLSFPGKAVMIIMRKGGMLNGSAENRRFALSYNVAQNFDISELVGDLTEEHRDAVIACADEGLPLIENAEVFAFLPPESRQKLVTIQLFRATGYERSYYSEKLARAQLSSYEKCLTLFSRPDIQKAAPEVVELFDQPELQEKTETLLTETREALYRDVFKRKGS